MWTGSCRPKIAIPPSGVFQIAASLAYRDVFPGQWGWMLASGIAD